MLPYGTRGDGEVADAGEHVPPRHDVRTERLGKLREYDRAMPDGGGDQLEPWQRLASRPAGELPLLRPRIDTVRNPRTGESLERLVLEAPDWVNVVALTTAGALVCVRQYRFGTGAIELEIPAGLVDDGESHRAAAERELREETGYASTSWSYLGASAPNPAFLDNLCHHWLAADAARTHERELDPGEDLAVVTVPLADVPQLVSAGSIRHALVISALARVLDLREGGGTLRRRERRSGSQAEAWTQDTGPSDGERQG